MSYAVFWHYVRRPRRATGRTRFGEHNVGQLVRKKYGNRSALVEMTTYDGTVTAADDWGGQHWRHRVRPANFLLVLCDDPDLDRARGERLERAIGVIYRPQTERQSHYFAARIARQFDAVLHFDRATALQPVDDFERWERSKVPETYPRGI